jgi:hypothetical protein
MVPLRKCPACRETVGALSDVCPRCGVNFRGAAIRRVIRWMLILWLVGWLLGRYVFKLI